MAKDLGYGRVELASGHVAYVQDGKAEVIRCGWAIEVASGNPEPDSPADCWTTVDCGEPMRDGGYGDDSVVCEAGHQFGGMERRLAPGGPEWEAEARAAYEEEGVLI